MRWTPCSPAAHVQDAHWLIAGHSRTMQAACTEPANGCTARTLSEATSPGMTCPDRSCLIPGSRAGLAARTPIVSAASVLQPGLLVS